MLNKIKFALVALLLPVLAFGQSYPSPTFNNLTVNGTFTATGKVGLASLASQAANTVVANATASSASPTAVAMPSCSSSTSALQWTSGSGFVCATSFANLGGATFTGALSLGYSNPAFFLNDTSSSGQPQIVFQKSATTEWNVQLDSTSLSFRLGRFPSGVFADYPLSVANATGLVTFADGITANGTNSISGYAPLASPALSGTPTAPTAALATNTTQIATTAFVLANAVTSSSPTITTPNIVGVSNGSNAAAGSVGEYLTANTSSTSMTSGSYVNCTSISLTAGDWNVQGVVTFVPAGSTVTSAAVAGVSTTSGGLGAFGTYSQISGSLGTGVNQTVATPVARVSLSSTTTVYIIGQGSFTSSTMTCNGFISARRVR